MRSDLSDVLELSQLGACRRAESLANFLDPLYFNTTDGAGAPSTHTNTVQVFRCDGFFVIVILALCKYVACVPSTAQWPPQARPRTQAAVKLGQAEPGQRRRSTPSPRHGGTHRTIFLFHS